MTTTFYHHGIDTKGRTSGTIKTLCPQCSHTRKKKNNPCLSVDIEKGVWNCHNPGCEWRGGLENGKGHNGSGKIFASKFQTVKQSEYSSEGGLSGKARTWFHERGITDEVLKRN